MEIANLSTNDVDDIVAVHVDAFHEFLMTKLGPRFLRCYYTTLLSSDGSILLGSKASGEGLLGFAAGSFRPASLYGRLLKRWPQVGMSILTGVEVRVAPSLAYRVACAAVKVLRRGDTVAAPTGFSELTSIAVKKCARGRDVGQALLRGFEFAARQHGSRGVYLTTDRDANLSVNRFYVRNGYKLYAEVHRGGGRFLNLYAKPLD